jgi:hypothetical protein
VNTSTARITSLDSPNRSKLAIAVVSALALVMALLTPAIPANATGSGSITQLSATSGPAGSNLEISGDVTGVTQVVLVGNNGTALSGISVTPTGGKVTITVPNPTTVSNPYDVRLVKADGSVTLNNAFSIRSIVPTISSISPTSGSASGYTAVTISGANFTGTTAVRFNTTNAVSFSILSDSRIVAYAPEGTAGATVRVYVQNGAGTTTSVANYKYKTSTCAAGTYLTTKFGSLSSTLTKKQKRDIREAADDFVSLGCEQVNLVKYIGVRAGSSATYKAYLTLQNKRANAVSDVLEKRLATWGVPVVVNEVKRAKQKSQAKKAAPDSLVKYRNVLLSVPSSNGIEVVYPNSGPTTGGSVVITGKGFTNVAETGAVRFGSTASPSYTVNANGTKITATVPAGVAGNTNVTVQTGVAGTSTAKLYSRGYTYVAAPTITSLGTTSGSILGGTSVTITGTGFTGVTAVRFGSVNALSYTVNSATSITAVTPPGAAGAVTATVVAAGGSIGSSFSYVSGPSITSMAWTGPGTLTITGTQLSGASLTVEGSTISISPSSTSTSLIATGVVEPTTTSKLVTVTTSAGVATKGIVDPVISTITWSTASGGTLTITGTGFAGADEVTVGGTSIGMSSGITISSTSIVKTGYTPTASSASVIVRTPLGSSAGVNFLAPPSAPLTPTAVKGALKATITVAAGAGATPASYLVSVVGDASKFCTVTGSSGSCEITGLLSTTAYTFIATATNASGTSAASTASGAITPDPAS